MIMKTDHYAMTINSAAIQRYVVGLALGKRVTPVYNMMMLHFFYTDCYRVYIRDIGLSLQCTRNFDSDINSKI